jgi:hypothetical protein
MLLRPGNVGGEVPLVARLLNAGWVLGVIWEGGSGEQKSLDTGLAR